MTKINYLMRTLSFVALSFASVIRRDLKRRTPGHLLGDEVGFRLTFAPRELLEKFAAPVMKNTITVFALRNP